MPKRYLLVADSHHNPGALERICKDPRLEDIDAVAFLGDTGNDEEAIFNNHLTLAKLGKPVYTMPGNYESVAAFESAVKAAASKHGNIISAFDQPKIEAADHHIVFVPGGDVMAPTGQYQFCQDRPGGLYKHTPASLRKLQPAEHDAHKADPEETKRLLHITNLGDVERQITDPERTMLFSHVPRRFTTPNAGDFTTFTQAQDGSIVPGFAYEQAARSAIGNISRELAQAIAQDIAAAEGLQLRKENRGNEQLAALDDRYNLLGMAYGHFHSGHRAHGSDGTPVPQFMRTRKLYLNVGNADKGKASIVDIGADVSYRMVHAYSIQRGA